MFKYAQIDLETGRCVSISYLSAVIDGDHILPLTEKDDVLPGDIYTDGAWTHPEQEPIPDPGLSAIERIEQLEAENAGLAQNQIRFDQMEQAQADLLFTLVQGGVL